MSLHYENALRDKKIYEDELNKLKIKMCEKKNFDG